MNFKKNFSCRLNPVPLTPTQMPTLSRLPLNECVYLYSLNNKQYVAAENENFQYTYDGQTISSSYQMNADRDVRNGYEQFQISKHPWETSYSIKSLEWNQYVRAFGEIETGVKWVRADYIHFLLKTKI